MNVYNKGWRDKIQKRKEKESEEIMEIMNKEGFRERRIKRKDIRRIERMKGGKMWSKKYWKKEMGRKRKE